MKIPKILLLLIVSYALIASYAMAQDYYVSPTGTASWSSATDRSTPCNATTALENAVAGDRVLFLDGTYTVTESPSSGDNYRYPDWQPANSGTADSPIIFKAENEHGAHLTETVSNSTNSSDMIGSYLTDGIVWDGFKITVVDTDGDYRMALNKFYSTDYSAIKNCDIRGGSHSMGGAINYEGIRVENSNNMTVSRCSVYDYVETSGNHNTGGFKSYEADNLTIQNCEFHNNTSNVYIKGYPHKNVTIKNNFIHRPGLGLLFTVGTVGDDYANENVSLINNVMIATTSIDYNAGGLMDNFVVANNTLKDFTLEWCPSNSTARATSIYNNIFYTSDVDRRDYVSRGANTTQYAVDHNRLQLNDPIRLRKYETNEAYYSTLTEWQSSGELSDGSNPGTGSITDDPQFVNATGTMSEIDDFALQDTSPCLGAGRDGADMGADVSMVGVNGTLTTTTSSVAGPLRFLFDSSTPNRTVDFGDGGKQTVTFH